MTFGKFCTIDTLNTPCAQACYTITNDSRLGMSSPCSQYQCMPGLQIEVIPTCLEYALRSVSLASPVHEFPSRSPNTGPSFPSTLFASDRKHTGIGGSKAQTTKLVDDDTKHDDGRSRDFHAACRQYNMWTARFTDRKRGALKWMRYIYIDQRRCVDSHQ
jgi:hypothetical protein